MQQETISIDLKLPKKWEDLSDKQLRYVFALLAQGMRELFRQFMSLLILEKTKLEEKCIYLDPRISFNEIDRYFFSGCACAYFQVAVDVYTDLRYNADEWE